MSLRNVRRVLVMAGLYSLLVPAALATTPVPQKSPSPLPSLPVLEGGPKQPSLPMLSLPVPQVRPAGLMCPPTIIYPSSSISPSFLVPFRYPNQQTVMADVAVQYAAIGEFDQAISTLKSIQEPLLRANKLVEIAKYQAPTQKPAALKLLAQALQLGQGLKRVYDRDTVLAAVARAYGTASEFEAAWKVAGSIKDAQSQTATLTEIALQAARSNQPSQASRSIGLIRERFAKQSALKRLAQQYFELGNDAQAFRIVQSLPQDSEQFSMLSDLFEASLRAGTSDRLVQRLTAEIGDCIKLEVATQIARSATSYYGLEARPAAEVAQRLATARAIAETIRDSALQRQSFGSIGLEYARAGEPEKALQLSQMDGDNYQQERVVTEVIRYYLRQKQPDLAAPLLALIQNSLSQATLLAEIAGGYAQLGQREKAAPLLAEALKQAQEYKPVEVSPFAFPAPLPPPPRTRAVPLPPLLLPTAPVIRR